MAIADGRIPEAGDVFWVDFGSPVGHEQAGRGPALGVSPRAYNEISSVFLVCPISRRERAWPFQVRVPLIGRIEGYALVDQVKTVDPSARYCRYVGHADSSLLQGVRRQLAILLQTALPMGE